MELNKTNYTVEEVKKILCDAFEDEKHVHKGAVKFMPVTIIDWYKSDIFKEQLSLNKTMGGKMREVRRSMDCNGTYFPRHRTIGLFIHGISKLKKIDTIASALETLYHELKHEYQHVLRNNVQDWEHFDFWFWKNDIENFVSSYSNNHYSNHHDEYYFEIEANLEGVNKGIECCEKKEYYLIVSKNGFKG